ncbi:hypothetical protein [Psychrobacter sp. NPDC078631]|uniref:hypothetical protein n=1 Tax=Psychrobacter sp. NPDC078631 TaxID=3390666 RepID=UPI003D0663CF
MSNLNNISSGSATKSKNIRPRRRFFFIASMVFIVLLAMYLFDRNASTLSQASFTNNVLTASNIATKSSFNNIPSQSYSQSDYVISDIYQENDVISYDDFKQEAQNVLFRDEGQLKQAAYSTHGITPTISIEDFREAHKTLYRESSY